MRREEALEEKLGTVRPREAILVRQEVKGGVERDREEEYEREINVEGGRGGDDVVEVGKLRVKRVMKGRRERRE